MGIAIVIFLVLVGPVIIWACMTGKESELARLKVLELEVHHKIESSLLKAINQNGLGADQLELIYERKDFFAVDDNSAPHFFKKLKIFRHSNSSYSLGIFYSNTTEGLLQKISELRARRALFLHPHEYQIAFGAYPHRDQLKPLLENSMKSRLEQFDPDLHAGEVFVTEPVGQEFGAKFK